MKFVRALLIALGVIVTLFGGWELLTENRPTALMGLAFWMIGALVLHDGVLAGIVVLTNRMLRTALSGTALTAAQAGLGIIATFAIIWIPVVLANGKVTQISALPLNYGVNLLAVLAVSGLITVALIIFFTARKKAKPSASTGEAEVEVAPEALPLEEAGAEPKQAVAETIQHVASKKWALPLATLLLVVGSGALILVLFRRRSS